MLWAVVSHARVQVMNECYLPGILTKFKIYIWISEDTGTGFIFLSFNKIQTYYKKYSGTAREQCRCFNIKSPFMWVLPTNVRASAVYFYFISVFFFFFLASLKHN